MNLSSLDKVQKVCYEVLLQVQLQVIFHTCVTDTCPVTLRLIASVIFGSEEKKYSKLLTTLFFFF